MPDSVECFRYIQSDNDSLKYLREDNQVQALYKNFILFVYTQAHIYFQYGLQ